MPRLAHTHSPMKVTDECDTHTHTLSGASLSLEVQSTGRLRWSQSCLRYWEL